MAEIEEEDIEVLRQELVKLGLRTVRGAKRRCPVDTGRLRASITMADSTGIIQDAGPEARATDAVQTPNEPLTIRVGTNVSYAVFVEYGTSEMDANPFLRPAVDSTLNELELNT